MRYTWIQRKNTDPLRVRNVTESVLAAADVRGVDRYYQRIMQERPKPGRGGLLPGEEEEVLYEGGEYDE